MSIMDMNSQNAMAEKLSIAQLRQAVANGTLHSFIAIPIIEEKTKLQSQMAAAQGGQQKKPSITAQILQQADQQEQQERGIDELPSNLPMMEDEEVGMAGGGIIAFAAGTPEGVKDPEQDPRIVALRKDPAYLAFAESGGIEGDTSLTAFLQAGNDTSTPVRYPLTDRERENIRNEMELQRGQLQSAAQQARDAYSPNNASLENRAPGTPMGEVFGTYADKLQRAIQGSESNVPSDLRAYSDRGMFSGIPLGGSDSRPPAAPEATDQPQPNIDSQYVAQDMQEGGRGITATPGARSVNPNVPGAPRPAPTGTPSAGPRTAPQGGAPSSGRGALPSTLAAAERSDSPAANQATSMLDKYIAQLEKSGESVGRDKKEALYMALIQGGLAAAGGMSPNALQNIAQGAMVGAQNYQQALASIKKDDRARLEKLISAGLKKEEFLLKAEEIGVKRDTARMVYDASMARTGAMGGSDAGATKQARLFAFNAGKELNRTEGDVAKLKNSDEYKEAARVMSMPYDPKKSSPAIKQMRERAQSVINSVNQETTRRVQDARNTVDFYRGEAGMPLLYSDGASGGGNMPKGIPQGSKQVGTSGGKPVYESPDGKRYIVE